MVAKLILTLSHQVFGGKIVNLLAKSGGNKVFAISLAETVVVPGCNEMVLHVLDIKKTRTPYHPQNDGKAGLDISACPLAQASVKSVGRVQITDHSPVWRVRFFIIKKLIKLQNKRCFLYSVLPRNL